MEHDLFGKPAGNFVDRAPVSTRTALVCLGPAAKGALEICQMARPSPAADQLEIAVEATSVNPIDVRRAEGYGPRRWPAVLQAGAAEVLDGTKQPFGSLGRTFDAMLNFASWDDDLALVRCLGQRALRYATTVHPLLGNLDRYGWVRGGLKSLSEKKSHRAALPPGVRNYAWTLFRPDPAALADLADFVKEQQLRLPIVIRKPLAQAAEAFDHVMKGRPGRALLMP